MSTNILSEWIGQAGDKKMNPRSGSEVKTKVEETAGVGFGCRRRACSLMYSCRASTSGRERPLHVPHSACPGATSPEHTTHRSGPAACVAGATLTHLSGSPAPAPMRVWGKRNIGPVGHQLWPHCVQTETHDIHLSPTCVKK